MAIIKTLKTFLGQKMYPKTVTKAIYDENGNRLDVTLEALNTSVQWKFLKSITGGTACNDIPQCNELYIVVFPGGGSICYEFTIPWVSIQEGVELYLNNGYGFGSNNNIVRLGYTKSSDNVATIRITDAYENNTECKETTKTYIYYR